MPVKQNLRLKQGNTFRKPLRYALKKGVDAQGNLILVPVDLTGAYISFEVMPTDGYVSGWTPPDKPIIFSSESGHILVTNPKAGEFSINLMPSVTEKFDWEKARYVINIKYPNGDLFTEMEGTIVCTRKI